MELVPLDHKGRRARKLEGKVAMVNAMGGEEDIYIPGTVERRAPEPNSDGTRIHLKTSTRIPSTSLNSIYCLMKCGGRLS